MKISARNVLKGKVVDVQKGATTAHVKLDVNGTIVTSAGVSGGRFLKRGGRSTWFG